MASARRPPSSMPDMRREDLRRDLLVELDVLVELREQRTAHRLDLVRAAGIARQRHRFGDQILAAVGHARDARALRAFDQHLHGAVGQLQHLQHRGDAADLVEVLRARVVLGGLLLRDEQDVLARVHRHVERLDRLGPPDEQRDDHVRKHDHVAQAAAAAARKGRWGEWILGTCVPSEVGMREVKMGAAGRPVKPPVGLRPRISLSKPALRSAPPPSWAGRRT